MSRSTASSRLRSVAMAELDDRASVEAARARGHVVLLLVASAGDVKGKQSALVIATSVEASEDRHNSHALHGSREVVPQHLRQLVGLTLERQRVALDLLVVLELELEQLDHLDGWPGGAGDSDSRPPISLEDLFASFDS